MNKEWTAPIRIENSLIKEGTQIVFSFAPSSIDIITEGRHCYKWPLDLPFNEISTLDVSGAWSTELASSFDIKLPSQILRKLPHGKNLLNKHQDDLIFDIGMNNGHDTDFYLKKGFRVISIEAIPTLCAVTAERFKDYVDCGKLVICNMGVSHSREELSFFINHNHNEWSSFDRDIASRGHPVTEIKFPRQLLKISSAHSEFLTIAKLILRAWTMRAMALKMNTTHFSLKSRLSQSGSKLRKRTP